MHGIRGSTAATATFGGVILLALALFLLTMPPGTDPDTPLPWDMSEHMLRSLSINEAVRSASPDRVLQELRAWSVYPPAFYTGLGLWMLVFGQSAASLHAFHFLALIVAIAGIWLGFNGWAGPKRLLGFSVASLCLLSTVPFVSLAHTPMLDAHASAWSIMALALVSQTAGRHGGWRFAAAITATLITLLTKHNFGLPLLVAICVLATDRTLRKDTTTARRLALVAAVSAAVWASFLTWQIHGWASLLSFSQNRANVTDWTFLQRAGWFVRHYASAFVPTSALAWAIGALAIASVRYVRHPLWLGSATYVAVSFLAIASHPYRLARLLLVPAVAMTLLAGMGIAAVVSLAPRRRTFLAALSAVPLLLAAVLFGKLEIVRADVNRRLPERRSHLKPVTAFLEDEFRGSGSALVIGTFNDFSGPWVKLLWNRVHESYPAPPMTTELWCPLERTRTGYDPASSPRYREILERHLREYAPDRVVTIEVFERAPWWDEDFRRWNQWKLNHVVAAARSPRLVPRRERTFERARVRVVSYDGRAQPIEYVSGWGHLEDWGRWILESPATIALPGSDLPRRLIISAATFSGQMEPQECTVKMHGDSTGTFTIDGPHWQWRDYAVDLPVSSEKRVLLELHFKNRWVAGDARIRAAPIQRVFAVTPEMRTAWDGGESGVPVR